MRGYKTEDEKLAKKFSPILVMAEDPKNKGRRRIFPKPVEIMGAHCASNLRFNSVEFFMEISSSERSISKEFKVKIRAKYSELRKIFPGSLGSKIDFKKNKFAFLSEKSSYKGDVKIDTLSTVESLLIKIADSLNVSQNSIKIKDVKSVVFRDPYFDYPGNKEKGTNDENWYYYYFHTNHPQRGSAFRNTAYVHISDQSDGKVLIQYYYFYPFNDWKNNHEGDWPRIDVIVTSRNPSTAELFGVNYWFHGEGINYTQKGGRVFNPQTHFAPAEGGSHPVAYVGAGSHGHFPTGGKYPRKAHDIIDLPEHMTKSGIILSTEIDTDSDLAQPYDLVMLPNPDTTNTDNMGLSPEMSWLGANVRWGELRVSSPGTPIVNIHNSSPVGPFHRDSWGKANKGKYKKTNVPYTEFQHFPIVGNVIWKGTIKLIGDIVIYPSGSFGMFIANE